MPRLARAMPRLVRVITRCPVNALRFRMNLTPSAVLGRLMEKIFLRSYEAVGLELGQDIGPCVT